MKRPEIFSHFSALLEGFADLAWPQLCLLCGTPLCKDESGICLECLYGLPALQWNDFTNNRMAERFWGKLPFEKAAAGFRYDKDSDIHKLVEAFKYKGEAQLAVKLGRIAAERLQRDGFFHGIDTLVPVPLHPSRLRKRGYNQSERIAHGISIVSGIPVCENIVRRNRNNTTQTTRNAWKRWENSQTLFETGIRAFNGRKHLLLVDDVLTSGSTLEACAGSIQHHSDAGISFFSLTLAMH